MEKETVIEDICPHLAMEDDENGNGYYFICNKNGAMVNANDCYHCDNKQNEE